MVSVRLPVDLQLGVVLPEETPVLEEPTTYTLVISNAGPYDATEVELTHPIPPGLELSNCVASIGIVTNQEGSLVWRVDTLPLETNATLAVTVIPHQFGSVDAEATVQSWEFELEPADNTNRFTLSVNQVADLHLTALADSDEILYGQQATVTFCLTNTGPFAALGITITNSLPQELELQQASTNVTQLYTNENGALVWTVDQLPPGSNLVWSIQVRPTQPGQWPIEVALSASTIDRTPEDLSTNFILHVRPVADVAWFVSTQAIGAVDHPWPISLALTNSGPNATEGLQWEIRVPDGLEILGATNDPGTVQVEAQTVHCALDRLDPGASHTFQLTLLPHQAGLFTNRLEVVDMNAYDPNPTNNTSTVVLESRNVADLGFQFSGFPDFLLVGSAMDLDLSLTNRGPAEAHQVKMHIQISPTLEFAEIHGDGIQWTQTEEGLVLQLDTLAPGTNTVCHLRFIATTEGEMDLEATISAYELDLNPADNHLLVSGQAKYGADLGLLAQAERSDVCIGCLQNFLIVVTNQGPQQATGVRLVSSFTGPVALLETNLDRGTVTLDPSGTNWIWEIGDLEPGEGLLGILAVAHQQQGAYTNRMILEASSFDVDPDNNQVELHGQIYPPAHIAILAQAPEPPLLVHAPATVTFVLTNQGDESAPQVRLLLAFSTNLELDSVDVSQGKYEMSSPGVVCAFGDMEPGQTNRVSVRFVPLQEGTMVVQATVISPAVDFHRPEATQRVELPILKTPKIRFYREGNRLVLSWPAGEDSFIVEYKNDLTDPEWRPLLVPRILVGDRYQVRIKLSRPRRFFRLRQGDIEPIEP